MASSLHRECQFGVEMFVRLHFFLFGVYGLAYTSDACAYLRQTDQHKVVALLYITGISVLLLFMTVYG